MFSPSPSILCSHLSGDGTAYQHGYLATTQCAIYFSTAHATRYPKGNQVSAGVTFELVNKHTRTITQYAFHVVSVAELLNNSTINAGAFNQMVRYNSWDNTTRPYKHQLAFTRP